VRHHVAYITEHDEACLQALPTAAGTAETSAMILDMPVFSSSILRGLPRSALSLMQFQRQKLVMSGVHWSQSTFEIILIFPEEVLPAHSRPCYMTCCAVLVGPLFSQASVEFMVWVSEALRVNGVL
jgi:hypothetical protein